MSKGGTIIPPLIDGKIEFTLQSTKIVELSRKRFHPAYILRLREPELSEVKASVLEDLKRVKARLDAL